MADFPAWGIHLTTSSLRGIKLERAEDGEKIRVVAHDQIDFAEDIEDVTSLDRHGPLLHALAVFSKRHDLQKCRVIVSVDGATAFNRFVSAPLVQGESLARILAFEAQQQIPFDLEEVYWDYKSLDVRQEDNEADVLLFAVRKEVIDERQRRLDKVRFAADGFQLSPVALYNYAVHERLAKDGYAIVSPDFDRIDVVICHGNRFWFRSLPTGIHTMFEDLVQRCGIKHRQAVKMVRGEVPPADAKVLKLVIREASERLGSQIGQLVSYYAGALPDVQLKGMVVIPGSPLVPSLAKPLKAATGLEVYAVKGFRQLEIDPAIVTPDIEQTVATLAHATGLALQGLQASEVSVKLHPATTERVIAGRRVFWVLSVLALLVTVGLMSWSARQHEQELETASTEVDRLVGELDAGRQHYDSLREENRIRDQIMPFREVGKARLAPVRALDLLLDTLLKTNAGAGPNELVYLVSADTKSADGEGMGGAGRRRVELILGTLETESREAALERLKRDVLAALADDWRSHEVTVGEDYSAASLSFAPTPNIAAKELRRKFLMVRVTFLFDDEMHAMGDASDG